MSRRNRKILRDKGPREFLGDSVFKQNQTNQSRTRKQEQNRRHNVRREEGWIWEELERVGKTKNE